MPSSLVANAGNTNTLRFMAKVLKVDPKTENLKQALKTAGIDPKRKISSLSTADCYELQGAVKTFMQRELFHPESLREAAAVDGAFLKRDGEVVRLRRAQSVGSLSEVMLSVPPLTEADLGALKAAAKTLETASSTDAEMAANIQLSESQLYEVNQKGVNEMGMANHALDTFDKLSSDAAKAAFLRALEASSAEDSGGSDLRALLEKHFPPPDAADAARIAQGRKAAGSSNFYVSVFYARKGHTSAGGKAGMATHQHGNEGATTNALGKGTKALANFLSEATGSKVKEADVRSYVRDGVHPLDVLRDHFSASES